MESIARFVVEHWTLIGRSPWLIGIVAAVAVVATVALWLVTAWRLGHWYYARQIENLKSEIRSLERQLELQRQECEDATRALRILQEQEPRR